MRNDRLRAERERQGLTRQALAELLQRHEAETTGRELAVDGHMIYRWEAGRRGVSAFYAERLEAVLGMPRGELGLVDGRVERWRRDVCGLAREGRSLDTEDEVTVPVLTADGRIVEVPISRRRFLQAGGVTFGALSFDTGTVLRTWTAERLGQVSTGDVEDARAIVRQLYAMGDKFGSDKLQPLAVAQLHRVQRLINEGIYTEQVGRGLHSVAGEAAEYAGWLSFDAWRHDEARFYFNEAVSMARLARDEPLTTHVLASMGLQSTELNRAGEAANMLTCAQETASRWGGPKLASLLHAREARARARMGDSSGCQKSLSHARRRLERTGTAEQLWLNFYDDSVVAYYSALSHADLNDHAAAVPLFREALAAPRPSRGTAMRQSDLARSLMRMGEVEEACHIVGQVMHQLPEVSSGRVKVALKRVARSVPASAADTAAVKDLTERLAVAGIA